MFLKKRTPSYPPLTMYYFLGEINKTLAFFFKEILKILIILTQIKTL